MAPSAIANSERESEVLQLAQDLPGLQFASLVLTPQFAGRLAGFLERVQGELARLRHLLQFLFELRARAHVGHKALGALHGGLSVSQ